MESIFANLNTGKAGFLTSQTGLGSFAHYCRVAVIGTANVHIIVEDGRGWEGGSGGGREGGGGGGGETV